MKNLQDLKLSKKSKKIVEDWLLEWLELFRKNSDNRPYWVYRLDFENSDFFFFTGCQDILSKDPEARAVENNKQIRIRKRNVFHQLLIKTLLGQHIPICKIKCNHCGFEPCEINGLDDLGGHWVYCPKCKKTDIHVFPSSYDTCMLEIKNKVKRLQNEANKLRVLRSVEHD